MINKSKIKKIAILSFDKNQNLNPEKIKAIKKTLKQNELREYVKAIKKIENQKTIELVIPNENTTELKEILKSIEKAYPDKKIVVKYDPSLIAGIRIINDDNVYELSVQGMLEDALSTIAKNYD